jgi:hypothetical protein
MRWVVLDSADTKSILRLAVKYQLHPLYIEDVIKLEVRPHMHWLKKIYLQVSIHRIHSRSALPETRSPSFLPPSPPTSYEYLKQRQRPRFYRYGGSGGSSTHYFLIFSLLRLVPSDVSASGNDNESVPGRLKREASVRKGAWLTHVRRRNGTRPIRIEKSQLAVFASGPPDLDTVVTLQGAWKPARTRCSRETAGASRSEGDGGQGGGGTRAEAAMSAPSAVTPVTTEGGRHVRPQKGPIHSYIYTCIYHRIRYTDRGLRRRCLHRRQLRRSPPRAGDMYVWPND